MRKYTICGSNICKFKKHNRLKNTGLTLNLSTFLPFVLWNLSEGRICLGMFLCQHLAFIFRVVTRWKRELSRSKQIKLIQQRYLTFETENFSCPGSCLTWKSPKQRYKLQANKLLRCFDTVFRRPLFLKVILSFYDRHKIFTTNWP